jgi:hypothetical protein
MLDELTEDDDGRIAAHIVALHKDPAATIGRAPFTMEQLQRYIKYARSIKPRITPEVRLTQGNSSGRPSIGIDCPMCILLPHPARRVCRPEQKEQM